MRQSNVTPSEIKKQLRSWAYVAKAIFDGLDGKPFHWGGGEFNAYCPKAEAMGITLVTKSQVKKLGYRLKQGAMPVGTGYFLAPISRTADLYVLECQCAKEPEPEPTNQITFEFS